MNAAWLYLLQGLRLVLPLVTVPYVTRVLGVEGYGHFAAGLNVAGYFMAFVSYGFDLTGVRAMSMAKTDSSRSRVYSEILTIKTALFVAAVLASLALVLSGVLAGPPGRVLLVLNIMLAGTAVQQVWLFQGLQRSGYMLFGDVLGHAVSLTAIFFFVRTGNDLLAYAACYALAILVSAGLSLGLARGRLAIRYRRPTSRQLLERLREGFPTFTTSLASAVLAGYGLTYMTLAGVSASDLGLYAAALKLATLLTALYTPLSQALLPRASLTFLSDFKSGIGFAARVIALSSTLWILIGVLLNVVSPWLAPLLFGETFLGVRDLLPPLTVWAVASVINNGLGVQILVASGHAKEYARTFLLGVASILVSMPVFVRSSGAIGAGWAAALSEGALLVGNVVVIRLVQRRAARD